MAANHPNLTDYIRRLKKYELGKIVHTLDFRNVWRGRVKKTGKRIALWMANEGCPGCEEDVMNEADILLGLKNSGILKVRSVIPSAKSRGRGPVLVSRFYRRLLSDVLDDERNGIEIEEWTSEKKEECIFRIAKAMKHAHANKVIHRNLKPYCIFMTRDLNPVISDWSWAIKDMDVISDTGAAGTPMFMAPEVINGEPYGNKVDVFSFAVSVRMMFTKDRYLDDDRNRWVGKNGVKCMMRVCTGSRFRRTPEIPSFYWDLITDCWAQNPDERPSFSEIVRRLRVRSSEMGDEDD
jgi:serine/threonine protein kinase